MFSITEPQFYEVSHVQLNQKCILIKLQFNIMCFCAVSFIL